MLQLSILTPGRVFFTGDGTIESVSVPSSDGQLGILKGHCPLVTSFATGILSVRSSAVEATHFALIDGFVKIQDNIITVLCRLATDSESLDSMETLEVARDKLSKDYESSDYSETSKMQMLKNCQKAALFVRLKKLSSIKT
jgi:F-type H+-transporting ATPase subunit epsilon